MTRLRMSLNASLVFLLFISGVVAQDGWSVKYNSKSFCTLKGTAVSVECTYTYPSGQSVKKAFWTKELVTSGSEPPSLLDDPEYRDRSQYLGNEQHDCTFRLRDVTEKDQRKYYFTFITDQSGGKYHSGDGIDLTVTNLQVEVPKRVKEEDNVTLTCRTTCSLTVRPTFTWYRDGHRLFSSTDQLHLQSVSREDGGMYSCAVLGQNSPQVTINIGYPPKNTSVSTTPSEDHRSVTLTCSSDAYPSVKTYTWFKEDSRVGSGHSYTAVQNGTYYCEAHNEHGFQKSAPVKVTVKGGHKGIIVGIVIAIIATVTIIGVVVWYIRKKKQEERNAKSGSQPSSKEPLRSESEKPESGVATASQLAY